MVSFGAGGFGWSGTFERMETDSGSKFTDVEYFLHNFSLNYAYRITRRFQLGGYFQSYTSRYTFHTTAGAPKTELETQVLGAFLIYNYSDTLSSAWFTGLSAGVFQRNDETSHDVALAESKKPFELDDAGEIYELVAGKRFRLSKWKIEHLTFAPQLSVYYKDHGKDFDDQKIKNGIGLTFQPVKFDFLF
jgi:hypothetical protein